MERMTIKEIQSQSLEILRVVDSFCRNNHLRYSLAGGTLLGAIRHKGFIPWDDDIDIIMPRPDFEVFCKSFEAPGYDLFCPSMENTYINCARVCEMKHTFVKCYTPWTNKETGIWIDILPIDGISISRDAFHSKATRIKELKQKMYNIRGAKRKILNSSPRKTIVNLYKALRYGVCDIYKYVRVYQDLIIDDYDSCEFCGQLTAPEYVYKEYFPKTWMEEFVEVPFESYLFSATKMYDDLLKNYFGDYFQRPPLEKRVPKHDELEYYWK